MTAAATLASWKGGLHRFWPGVGLSALIAIASAFIAEHRGGPTLLYALLLGMALNGVAVEGRAKAGADFAASRILRFGVALLGARITADHVAALGWQSAALIVAAVGVTIGFGAIVAGVLGVSRRIGILTGGATAICGASAAIAIAAVLPRDERSERELIFTIAGVTLLSTLAMIVYPVVAGMLGLDAHATGVFLGATIHDVAQVVGAGYSISPAAGDAAVLAKLMRVALLLPVVVAISFAVRHRLGRGRRRDDPPPLPAFLVGFVALVAAGSFGLLPEPLLGPLNELSRACLVLAIAAVGLKTSALELRTTGLSAAVLLCVEALFLAVFVLTLQRWL